MRKIILICMFFIAFVVKSNAQEKYLELTKNNTSRILKIEEDKRVVVKTKDNKRFVGKLKFIDSLHVGIDSNTIHLDSISFIKKRSIGGVVLRSVSFYVGANLFIIGFNTNWDWCNCFSSYPSAFSSFVNLRCKF
mgnify:CR=1 FL=1